MEWSLDPLWLRTRAEFREFCERTVKREKFGIEVLRQEQFAVAQWDPKLAALYDEHIASYCKYIAYVRARLEPAEKK